MRVCVRDGREGVQRGTHMADGVGSGERREGEARREEVVGRRERGRGQTRADAVEAGRDGGGERGWAD